MPIMNPDYDLDYETDVNIDPDQLDVAALDQSNLTMKYNKAAAYYSRASKQAHEKVKALRAKLVKDANDYPDELLGKGVKPTGSNVEAYYRLDPDYQQAKKDWIEAEYNNDLAQSAANTISFQRGKMIEELIKLLHAEYFSGPTIPRDLAHEYRQKRKERIEAAETSSIPTRTRRRV